MGVGKHVLKIDTTKVGKGEKFSLEEPLECPIDKLVKGIQLVGSHDGEVTDLSMCQWMTTRLVSASVDGTVCHNFCSLFPKTILVDTFFSTNRELAANDFMTTVAFFLICIRVCLFLSPTPIHAI